MFPQTDLIEGCGNKYNGTKRNVMRLIENISRSPYYLRLKSSLAVFYYRNLYTHLFRKQGKRCKKAVYCRRYKLQRCGNKIWYSLSLFVVEPRSTPMSENTCQLYITKLLLCVENFHIFPNRLFGCRNELLPMSFLQMNNNNSCVKMLIWQCFFVRNWTYGWEETRFLIYARFENITHTCNRKKVSFTYRQVIKAANRLQKADWLRSCIWHLVAS